jgi:copper chaperone CopZ
MKTIKIMIAVFFAAAITTEVNAQMHDHSAMTAKTESFFVNGLCEMCQDRIEKAASIDGVSKADWNIETKILTLVYDPSSVRSDDILKSISAAGHDNEKFRAPDDVYNNLPACCKYDRSLTKTSDVR